MLPINLSGMTASNAAFNVMGGAQNASSLSGADQENSMGMLQNQTLYKMGDALYESDKKLRDENIKSTFSYMA